MWGKVDNTIPWCHRGQARTQPFLHAHPTGLCRGGLFHPECGLLRARCGSHAHAKLGMQQLLACPVPAQWDQFALVTDEADNAPLGWAGWGSLASLWEPPGDGGWGFREEIGNGRGARGASRLGVGWAEGLGPEDRRSWKGQQQGTFRFPVVPMAGNSAL